MAVLKMNGLVRFAAIWLALFGALALTGCPSWDKAIDEEQPAGDDDDDNDASPADDDDDNDDSTPLNLADFRLWAVGRDEAAAKGVLLVSNGDEWLSFPIDGDLPSNDWELTAASASGAGVGALVGRAALDAGAVGFGVTAADNAFDFAVPSYSSQNWTLSDVDRLAGGKATLGFAVGADAQNQRGVVFREASGVWTSETVNGPANSHWSLSAVSMLSQYDGYAFGQQKQVGETKTAGLVVVKGASAWTVQVLNAGLLNSYSLAGGQAVDQDNIWAVGEENPVLGNAKGLIVYSAGDGNWAKKTVPSVGSDNWSLVSVGFAAPDFGFAVGNDSAAQKGVILMLDGPPASTAWQQIPVLFFDDRWTASRVLMAAANEGYIVGRDLDAQEGLILKFADSAWRRVDRVSYNSSDWRLSGIAAVP
jgi:hypothetical protein